MTPPLLPDPGGVLDGPGGWRIERRGGDAASLHHAELPTVRSLVVNEVTDTALVLGSSQPDDDVDLAAARAAGVVVARRRSGGGAVLLAPGRQLWVDVVVPVGDPLHDDDVLRSAWWVGDWWVAALDRAAGSGSGLAVHRGSLSDPALGAIACFASTGAGEVGVVSVPGGGPAADQPDRKLVGISQRRTRVAARIQTVVHLQWDPERTLELLRPEARARVEAALRFGVAPVHAVPGLADRSDVVAGRLLAALVAALPG